MYTAGTEAMPSLSSMLELTRHASNFDSTGRSASGLQMFRRMSSIAEDVIYVSQMCGISLPSYISMELENDHIVDAINTEPQLVSTLHSKLNELRIVFAVDLRSTLSIVITSTDNDGD